MHCRVVTNGEKDRLCTQPSCCDSAIPVRSEFAITILARARYELEGEKHFIELVNSAAVFKLHMTQGTLSPKREPTRCTKQTDQTTLFQTKTQRKTGTEATVFQSHLAVVTAKLVVFS